MNTMNLDDIIPAIQGRNWYALAALAIWALIAIWKQRSPELYYRIPDGWRWLPPVLLAVCTGFVDGFASGLPWRQAALRALFAVLTMGIGAMGIHGAAKASPLSYGGGPSAVLLCALALPALTGCTEGKVIARGANDIARDLCALHYGQREGISLDDAARTFCQDLRPWLDLVLRAQRDGTPLPSQCGDAGAQ